MGTDSWLLSQTLANPIANPRHGDWRLKSIHKMENKFKNGIEPQKRVVVAQADRPKLNPPKFQEELISFHNPNIAWGFSLEKSEFKTFFR